MKVDTFARLRVAANNRGNDRASMLTPLRLVGCLALSLVGLISTAGGTVQWSATLTNQDTGVTYSTSNFSTKEQAVTAMKSLDAADDSSGSRALLIGQSVATITAGEVIYNFAAPTRTTVTQSPVFYWLDSQIAVAFPTAFPSEASAAAAATSGACPAAPGDLFYWAPTGAWILYRSYLATGQPGINFENRQYTWYTAQGPNCTVFLQEASWSPNLMYQYQPVTCPSGYEYAAAGSGPPPWPCRDKFIGTVTGPMLECAQNGSPATTVGDPCDVSTGDFSQTESDYSGAGLHFQRNYHSLSLEMSRTLGVGWTHNYGAYLVLTNGVPTGLVRPDGHHDAIFRSTATIYISLSGAAIHVQQSGANWTATLKDGSSEVYNTTGQLIELVTPGGMITALTYNSNNQLSVISSPFGQAIQLSYNINNQLQQLIDPAGNSISYVYGANNNLTSATYQDGTKRTYLYENSTFPNNMTGLLDENNSRFLTVGYDSTTGVARSSQQAGGAQAVSIVYNTNTSVVTDSLGAVNTYTFTTDVAFAPRVNAFSRNGLNQTFTVPTGATDPQRRVTQSSDANGNITTYAFDTNHLTSKTKAFGTTLARTTSYQYLSTMSALPTLITEPLRQTSYAYFPGTDNVQTKTITDIATGAARSWNYTYNSSGQVLTVDGPRTDVSDVTTYTYYTCTTGHQCGQINTVKNALGQITTFNTYNAHGQPLTVTDPNGVVTTLTYDLRQRVKSRAVGTETTGYSYYPTGILETVTLPDTSIIQFGYDAAHRLSDITDGLGNHIHYILDAMGNRTAENAYDPSNSLHRTHTRVFNALNEIYQDINAGATAAVTTTLAYDNDGNLTSSDAPLTRNTANKYDALNHLTQVTDPKSGITILGYDANDKLASVKDPRTFTTSYSHNGFGDVTQTVSPDTGTTINTYDSAGNLHTATDARGALATYAYDAVNRVTEVTYSDQAINFTYDAGTNGKGRLTGASDANHSLSWSYDTHGRVTGKGQTVGSVTKSVGYSYTNGDITSVVTPSGQTITYTYTNHHISSILVGSTTLLSSVTYDPFGPATGWTWGNSSTVSRAFDEDGNPHQIVTAAVTNAYTVDNASRITGISDSGLPTDSWTFGYDTLDRVTSGTSSTKSRGYTYDANSNRLTTTGTTGSTETISTTNNRLNSTSGGLVRTYGYDNAGNVLSYTGDTFTFNQRGRMSSATVSAGETSYFYNALGQLIEKSGNGGTTLLMYDETGHLLGEYSSSGALIQETIWMGNLPVATLRPNGSTGCTSTFCIFYVHTDHLGSPRKVTTSTSANSLMWRWDPDTFGSVAPNSNPSGLGTFTYNLRFPGQYSLNETGLFYNHFRDYDPAVGRYIESDPIGLRGGANTYGYASENPISIIDPLGLWTLNFGINIGFQVGFGSFSVSGGVVVDGPGNVGTYGTIYVGPGLGLDASIGLAVGGSNAPSIYDLAGPFAQTSGNVGAGLDVGGSVYMGATPDHQGILGGEVSFGAGIGGGFSGGVSDTIISLIGNLRSSSSGCP